MYVIVGGSGLCGCIPFHTCVVFGALLISFVDLKSLVSMSLFYFNQNEKPLYLVSKRVGWSLSGPVEGQKQIGVDTALSESDT